MGKRTKTRMMIDGINQIEGFRPEELAIQIEDQKHIPVKDRISWFKLFCPTGSIIVGEPTYLPDIKAYNVHAEILDGNRNVIASGNGTASYHENDDYGKHPVECAETKAIGRALASAGFGNQFSGSDFVQNEPIDTGVPIESKSDNTDNDLNDLFEDGDSSNKKNEEFENKVAKIMKTYTPEMSKGIMLSYGPCQNNVIADAYKSLPAEKRIQTIKEYAYPDEPDFEHAGQIAACRVFLNALENSKK